MNNNEPIVIGKVKKNKTGKPIVVLILFLFIGSIVLFLPNIKNYFEDYDVIKLIQEGKIIDFFINHDKYMDKKPIFNNNNTTNNIIEDSKKLINHKTELKNDKFTLSNFNLTNEKITFKLVTSENMNFDKLKYYLTLTKNNKVITNIKLVGMIENTSEQSFEFINDLEDLLEIYGEIKIIQESEYPKFNLKQNELGEGILMCTLNNDRIEYIFKDNKLIKIKEIFRYYSNNNEDENDKKYQEYNNLKNKINNNGGTALLVDNPNGFRFNTDIDLNTFSITNINNYYSLNTKSNIINFEMIAKGYDCK